uniref:Uncharacterized protein n=1 Tax=Pristionchus pacificus TaxID=54126 RepID=A0A2A6BNK6_PRIPA|eukprot:PDM67396.1 hypothetical protein PRIPAC_48813 [Pristionchus pacificus]
MKDQTSLSTQQRKTSRSPSCLRRADCRGAPLSVLNGRLPTGKCLTRASAGFEPCAHRPQPLEREAGCGHERARQQQTCEEISYPEPVKPVPHHRARAGASTVACEQSNNETHLVNFIKE